ncbi:MAG: GGDEF domain-containing protein [Gammaproteobacteria bacterium]|nr:GGDEF domain-containing protein [Gammaproteobacteria bacterium]MDH5650580.1 GGDEF domain-containing protein [Gammaproteobacteria bacterium]
MQLNHDTAHSAEDRWRQKYHATLAEQNLKAKQWLDAEQLLRTLVSHLGMLVDHCDDDLEKKLQRLRKAFREGSEVLQQEKLIREISEHILALKGVNRHDKNSEKEELSSQRIRFIGEVLLDLLDHINFPTGFIPQIDKIKQILLAPGATLAHSDVIKAVNTLEAVLQDIFQAIREDKKNIEQYLHQLSGELKNIDEGINATQTLATAKQQAEAAINDVVESEVQGMEHSMTTVTDLERLKHSVQDRLDAIRVHMDNFKQQEAARNDEAVKLAAHLGKQLRRMEQECDLLKKQILEKHEQTMSDTLTGIRNRLAYEEAVKTEVERFQRYGRPLCLLVLDLDNFKIVNDTHGHAIGDKALQFIAKILAGNIRSVDFLARYGGEEFVIILPELSLKDAKSVADKIRKAIERNKFVYKDQHIPLTVSGGIAQIHKDDTAESFFERADDALYVAKERGRNRIETE